MSAPAPLLSAAAGTGRQSRSASKAVVKAASGFHVFRIEGYSLTKTIPGGEKISSQDFTVGGRRWRVDMYPNGTDSSKDESDSIALYLVYHGEQAVYRHVHEDHEPLNRLRAQYKFCLLDHAGNAAYELPAEKVIFTCSSGRDDRRGCGHDTFISWDELEGRHARLLLKDDCLAIRCDVGVIDQLRIQSIAIGAKRSRSACDDTDTESSSYSDDSCFDTDSDESRSSRRRNKRRRRRRRRQQTQLDDREYVLQTFES
jgi:speckle-type POZ protein